ncbi:hypothetical protein ACFOTA_12330 [Chitinophaga sp. GCM10012297]|uniref:Uncharacterized protein n=1 Tax=Chitinophaga chungangae TaxID=2821488 RepID=A0ABS3YEA4_9BACT|nr:hypothetical protein [Chitinophaga chungangae]MBO9152998.1 hypothetical protein [Chitinophaga chungangae]
MNQTSRWLLLVACAFPVALWSLPCLSQTKQPKSIDITDYLPVEPAKPKLKKQAAPMSDLDRLYRKYKTAKQITIFSAGDKVVADAEIQYNDAGKPKAIILSGESSDLELLLRIRKTLIGEKLRAGYKRQEDDRGFETDLLQKRTEYAKYEVIDNSFLNSGKSIFETRVPHSFRFEVGDTKRQGNGNTESFSF